MGFKLPYMRNVSRPTKKYIVNFGGLNLTENYKEGELSESENMTSERSPTLASVRPYYSGYLEHESGKKLNSIWSDGNLFAAIETNRTGNLTTATVKFKNYDEKAVQVPDLEALGGSLALGDSNVKALDFVRINNKLTVFSSGGEVQINGQGLCAPYTINLDPNLESHTWESVTCIGEGNATCDMNMLRIQNVEGYTWFGGAGGKCNYKEGDTIEIYVASGSGDSAIYLDKPDFYGVLQSNAAIVGDETFLLFTSNIFETLTQSGETSIWVKLVKETPPFLEFATPINNRIWAVKENTIYASALGEPSRWNVFDGLSSDSYQLGVDSSLDFTGMSEFSSNPIIFKEDIIYRIYGTMPSNYSLQKIDAPGVMKGCARSIQKINEVLYYKGRSGVYRYAGGVPQCISTELGDMSDYKYAVAGSDDRYYYLTMQKGSSSKRITFVYDTFTGVWQKETALNIVSYAQWGGVLYSFESDSGNVYSKQKDSLKGLTAGEVSPIEWSVTFKPFTETIENRKVYSKLSLRLELEEGAWCSVLVQHDNKLFEEVKTVKGEEDLSTVIVPIRLRPCDKFTIKLEGRGYCCLHTLVREYRTGGDR